MRLLRSAIIQTDGKRFVECDMADHEPAGNAPEFIRFRLAVDPDGYPLLPKCLLEALRRARRVVAEHSAPLEDPVTRGF